MVRQYTLAADTKLKVVATNKLTGEETITFMSYSEWINLNKSTKFYYKAYGTTNN